MFPHVLCERIPYTSFKSFRVCRIQSWLFLVCVHRGSHNKAWAVALKASFWCGHCSASEAQMILDIDIPLCTVMVETFLYPIVIGCHC